MHAQYDRGACPRAGRPRSPVKKLKPQYFSGLLDAQINGKAGTRSAASRSTRVDAVVCDLPTKERSASHKGCRTTKHFGGRRMPATRGSWLTLPNIFVCWDALLSARHSIWIFGWDIHSRMRFFGANEPVDGWPRELGEFLKALATARSELSINVLVWKSIILYAGEREWFPAAQFEGPDNLVFCLDDSLPLGSAQHQKFVVIDDSLAFAGGLDLTIRRWDDHTHAARSGD